MRKQTLLPFSALVLCTIIGCNPSSKEQKPADSSASANNTLSAVVTPDSSPDSLYLGFEGFFTEVFNERYYEDEGFIEKYCTDKLRAKLKEAYEYEYEDDGYATWLFRSEFQDGPSEDYGLTKITNNGDGIYTYEYTDMGKHGSHRIKVIANQTPRGNIEFYIDELE